MQCYAGKREQGKRTGNVGWGIMFIYNLFIGCACYLC